MCTCFGQQDHDNTRASCDCQLFARAVVLITHSPSQCLKWIFALIYQICSLRMACTVQALHPATHVTQSAMSTRLLKPWVARRRFLIKRPIPAISLYYVRPSKYYIVSSLISVRAVRDVKWCCPSLLFH